MVINLARYPHRGPPARRPHITLLVLLCAEVFSSLLQKTEDDKRLKGLLFVVQGWDLTLVVDWWYFDLLSSDNGDSCSSEGHFRRVRGEGRTPWHISRPPISHWRIQAQGILFHPWLHMEANSGMEWEAALTSRQRNSHQGDYPRHTRGSFRLPDSLISKIQAMTSYFWCHSNGMRKIH